MRKLCTPLLIFLTLFCFLLHMQIAGQRIPSTPGTLVSLTEMPPYCAEKILYHDYWNDFLQYTDGHEILAFRTKENLTHELKKWTHVSSVTLDEIQSIVPIELHHRFFAENASGLPASYTAYFLSSTFEGDDYSWDDEYIIGLYDAKSRICVIYRGHHFYFP